MSTKVFNVTAVFALLMTLTACNDTADQPQVGGLNTADAKAVDDAAAKLDAENDLPPMPQAQPQTQAQTQAK
jgi:sugar phosphate permease